MQKPLTELTDEELLQQAKQRKSANLYDALILGVLVGVAAYSTFKNGWGLLTFIPLVYLPIAAKNKSNNKALDRILKERNVH